MTVELVNPEGLPKPEAYAQVAVASGSRTAYVSGQGARDTTGAHVGAGDLAAQVEQAYVNVGTALAGVGGGFEHVAMLTVYVVDCSPDKLDALVVGAVRAAERLGADIVRPITLIGVAALAEPDLLVEVEAVVPTSVGGADQTS